jgi:hypothetical protein
LNLDFLYNALGQHRLSFFHVDWLLISLLPFFEEPLHLQYFAISFGFYLLCDACKILMAHFFSCLPNPMWLRILLNFFHFACGGLLYVIKWNILILSEDLLIILEVTVIKNGLRVSY